MIVVDASAAVKLLLDEADSAAIRDWFRDVEGEVAAPDLLNVEVTQAVVRRVNSGQIVMDAARSTLRDWRAVLDGRAIRLRRTDVVQVSTAAELAMQFRHPVKDCLYLALALELSCDLATCDVKFRDKAAPHYPQIRLLADLA